MPGMKSRGPSSTDVAADRLQGLLHAHRLITSDLNLSAMLERIVRAACDLVSASHGTFGVMAVDGTLDRVVQYAAVEGPPASGESLPSTNELRVPIKVADQVFGILCLIEPEGRPFDSVDAEVIEALAATAGTAIENARLYEDAARSRDWLRASGEITRALLAEADTDMLMEVVSRALHVAEADYGALVLPTDDGRLKVTVTAGIGADHFDGLVFDPTNSPLGATMIRGRSLLVTDMSTLASDTYENSFGYGPVIVAPLIDAKGIRGSVILIRITGRPAFTVSDLDLLTTFADQVALALEMADARFTAETLRELEHRHQIAQDLHDNVMQRLFATGVGLQRVADGDISEDTEQRLRRYIRELDETIDEIRDRVFGLRAGDAEASKAAATRFPRMVPTDVVSYPEGSRQRSTQS